MSDSEQCCKICFRDYGLQEDGIFLSKDSPDNHGIYDHMCKHYFCWQCIIKMRDMNRCECGHMNQILCPLCRCDWTEYLDRLITDDEADETEDEKGSEAEDKELDETDDEAEDKAEDDW